MLSNYGGNANPTPGSQASDKPLLVSFASPQIFDNLEVTGTLTLSAMTAGSIPFIGTGGLVEQDNANLFWNNTNNQLLLGTGSAANPSYSFGTDTDTGIWHRDSNVLSFAAGGTDVAELQVGSTFWLKNNSGNIAFGSVADLFIHRDAANVIGQRNGGLAQTYHLYNAYVDSVNFERARFIWSGNTFFIDTHQDGTGSPRDLNIGTTGFGTTFTVRTAGTNRWQINADGHFIGYVDNTYDIGGTGVFRPRSIYIGTSIQIEANNGLKLTNQVTGAGVGGGTLTNAPSAGNPDFWVPITVNGTNMWFPAWAV